MSPAKLSHSAPLPLADGKTVPVYHWVPPVKNYVNFGDELAPMIVAALLRRCGSHLEVVGVRPGRSKLIAVGSVIQQARNGDVIWGSGVNGKSWPRNLDVHKDIAVASVRGPLTKEAFDRSGIACPAIYGDPGLLFPDLFKAQLDDEISNLSADQIGGIVYIPNLNDERLLDRNIVGEDAAIRWLSPNQSPLKIAAQLASADLVLSSSLHGIVLADAMGVPARPILSMFEPAYKYVDYMLGTGREATKFSLSLAEALTAPDLAPAVFDAQALISSFPITLLG